MTYASRLSEIIRLYVANKITRARYRELHAQAIELLRLPGPAEAPWWVKD